MNAATPLTITNPDKIYFSAAALSKEETLQYYAEMMDVILPHVQDRPLSLLRCPDGAEGECFYQKDIQSLRKFQLPSVAYKGKSSTPTFFPVIKKPAHLLQLVQLGTLEFHPWGSKADKLMQPDRLIFDLDPGPGIEWRQLIKTAELLRDVLKLLQLRSFVKTSGGKGLHVVVPIQRSLPWKQLLSFAKNLSEGLVHSEPDLLVSTMVKAKRIEKIFVDYLRNVPGATCVAPYSTRANPHATLSYPLTWEELCRTKGNAAFTIPTVLKQKKAGKNFAAVWEDFFTTRQRISAETLKRVSRLI